MSLSSDLAVFYNAIETSQGPPYLHRSDILQLLAPTPDFQSFKAALEKIKPEERLLVLLRALASQKTALGPRLVDSELVVTFPGQDSINARHTLQVVRQMITAARSEILVAGFAITEAGGVLPQLSDAASRGVRVVLLCSSWQAKDGRSAVELTRTLWPAGVPLPQVYQYSGKSASSAGMHIKCLLVDGSDMLIGSANFTFPGLNTNFEMGVRINGHVAQSARTVFDEFLRTGGFTEILLDRGSITDDAGPVGA